MPQVNDNQDPRERGKGDGENPAAGSTPLSTSGAVTAYEEEIREQRVQERHLRMLRGGFFTVVAVVLVLGFVLYGGHEAPPWSMRFNQPADSTGYQAPPRTDFVVAGTVPRTGVSRELPDDTGGTVQPEVAKLVNPAGGDAGTLKLGAQVYADNCAFCHGVHGIGDGPAGESYVPHPPDLTTVRVQGHPDGVIYRQITNGILSTPIPEAARYLPREWHAFRGTIDERDRWACVAFVKTLKADTVSGATAPAPAPANAPGEQTPALGTMPPPGQTY